MKKILKIALIVIVSVIFVGTLVFLYNKSKPKPQPFDTKTPFIANVIKKTVATGKVVPRKEAKIKPNVSGIIEIIYVNPGKIIRKGDVLAKVKIIPDMISLNNAEGRLNQAKINYEDAKLIYDRQKKIFDQGVIPEAEFQKARISLNTTKQDLDAAENNLELVKEGVLKKSGQTSNTLIRSTIDGMVLVVPVKEGSSVIQANTFNEGTTIAEVADMGEMIFEGKVDETEVGKLKPGMKLIMTIGAIENEKFDAVLEYIAPKGTEQNGAIQFEIKAKIKLSDKAFIRSGYSANADIVLDRRDSVMVIEERLLKFNKDTACVDIETAPQQFEKRIVKLGLSDGINIEVLDGLKISDKIKVDK